MPDNISDLAFVNVHGTATAYNDEMESIALTRAGLQHTPVNALKGYFGHTLGAAGILETIISLHTIRKGIIAATKGYAEQGTTQSLNISSVIRHTNKTQFIKLLSGFGGCNAAVRIECGESRVMIREPRIGTPEVLAEVFITPTEVKLNGEVIPTIEHGEQMLTELYRTYVKDYPKFFKMDTLSRLGFVAGELLFRQTDEQRFVDRHDRAIIFANRSASLKNDADYNRTISDSENYYPSPALFVYTLPNIVTGEVAIRNKYFGETSFYVLPDEKQLQPIVDATMRQSEADSAIVGWVECSEADIFEAHLKLIKQQ